MGSCSLLVDPYNVNQIAKSMDTLCNDIQLRETLIRKGLENSAKFSWEDTVQKTLKALEQN